VKGSFIGLFGVSLNNVLTINNHMNYKKKTAIIFFLLLGLLRAEAQVAEAASGGEATGSNGSVSYSVGQIFYTAATGADGSISSGVQQAYEISSTLGIGYETISLDLSVYPNPTADILTLKVEETSQLTYRLYNVQGILIDENKVNGYTTAIDLEAQPSATYFLTVLKNNEKVKTFKIIKNN